MTHGSLIIIKNGVAYAIATNHTGMHIAAALCQLSSDELLNISPLLLLDKVLDEYHDPYILPLVINIKEVPEDLQAEMRYAYITNIVQELAEQTEYPYFNAFDTYNIIDQDTKDITSDGGEFGRVSRWKHDLIADQSDLHNLIFSRDGLRILKKNRVATV